MMAVGNTPEDLYAIGILNTSIPIVFSHASFITARGAQLLRQTNQHISITAESEMHYGQLELSLIWWSELILLTAEGRSFLRNGTTFKVSASGRFP